MKVRSIALLTALTAGAVVAFTACGGGDSTSPPPGKDAGPDTTSPPPPPPPPPPPADAGDSGQPSDAGDGGVSSLLPGPSRGSAVAIAPNDKVAVVCNRDVGTVTVLSLAVAVGGNLPTVSVVKEVAVGNEPWQVVISPDSTTAYVVLRKDQKLAQITGLNTASPALGMTVAVGSEPTGVALTPTGASAFVANWVDGTVTQVTTSTMTVKGTTDLNAALLADSHNYLGSLTVAGATALTTRPALAHPRSLAITNGGTGMDSNEFIYVTEYYAQATAPETVPEDGGLGNSDTRKVGLVYKIKVADGTVPKVIQLQPLTDMGFTDEKSQTVGCYPNQLQSIGINGKFAYVTSVCASPGGPTGPKVTTTTCANGISDCAALNLVAGVCAKTSATASLPVCIDTASVKTTTAPLVSVIDTSVDSEVTASGTAITSPSLNAQFGATGGAGAPRLPLLSNDMAFVPGTSVGYVSANGSDAVFRVVYDGTGKITSVGSTTNPMIDLHANRREPERTRRIA